MLNWRTVLQGEYKNSVNMFCLAFRRISKNNSQLFVHFYITSFLWDNLVTKYVFTVRGCQHLAQPQAGGPPLSFSDYSIYSQLRSILEAVLPTATWGRAMPWWQGPINHGRYVITKQKYTVHFIRKKKRLELTFAIIWSMIGIRDGTAYKT
jgi:hypothetical protein